VPSPRADAMPRFPSFRLDSSIRCAALPAARPLFLTALSSPDARLGPPLTAHCTPLAGRVPA
jgi:hypothetical protein